MKHDDFESLFIATLGIAMSDSGGGGDVVLKNLTVTQNGVTTAPSGEAYKKVTVNVPQPSGSVTFTENGSYDVTDKAEAVVAVPEPPAPTYQQKTVTQNGEVTADDGYDALSKVVVNVPGPDLEEKSVEYSTNGTYTVQPSSGKDGISEINIEVNVPNPSSGSLEIDENGTYDVSEKASAIVNVPQGEPIEVSTAAGMTAVLIAANVGKAYKFTGTTDETYTNGDIYVVEESA